MHLKRAKKSIFPLKAMACLQHNVEQSHSAQSYVYRSQTETETKTKTLASWVSWENASTASKMPWLHHGFDTGRHCCFLFPIPNAFSHLCMCTQSSTLLLSVLDLPAYLTRLSEGGGTGGAAAGAPDTTLPLGGAQLEIKMSTICIHNLSLSLSPQCHQPQLNARIIQP